MTFALHGKNSFFSQKHTHLEFKIVNLLLKHFSTNSYSDQYNSDLIDIIRKALVGVSQNRHKKHIENFLALLKISNIDEPQIQSIIKLFTANFNDLQAGAENLTIKSADYLEYLGQILLDYLTDKIHDKAKKQELIILFIELACYYWRETSDAETSIKLLASLKQQYALTSDNAEIQLIENYIEQISRLNEAKNILNEIKLITSIGDVHVTFEKYQIAMSALEKSSMFSQDDIDSLAEDVSFLMVDQFKGKLHDNVQAKNLHILLEKFRDNHQYATVEYGYRLLWDANPSLQLWSKRILFLAAAINSTIKVRKLIREQDELSKLAYDKVNIHDVYLKYTEKLSINREKLAAIGNYCCELIAEKPQDNNAAETLKFMMGQIYFLQEKFKQAAEKFEDINDQYLIKQQKQALPLYIAACDRFSASPRFCRG